MRGLIGPDGANVVSTLIERAAVKRDAGWIATAIGLVTIAIGASGAFGQLQYALNEIWNVRPEPSRGGCGVLRDRFLSFSMVLVIGFLLLVALVVSAALSALDDVAGAYGDYPPADPRGRQLRRLVRDHHPALRRHLQGAARAPRCAGPTCGSAPP